MNAEQLRNLIIQPTLQYLRLDSLAAQNLLLGTAAQESQMGVYIKQINGSALGIYQMELFTFKDITQRYLGSHDKIPLRRKVIDLTSVKSFGFDFSDLAGNLYFATALARLKYLTIKELLPDADDIEGLAKYWKKYYNTYEGKGTESEFIANYKKYVL